MLDEFGTSADAETGTESAPDFSGEASWEFVGCQSDLPPCVFKPIPGLRFSFYDCDFGPAFPESPQSRRRAQFDDKQSARLCVLNGLEPAWKRADALRYVNDSGPQFMDLEVIQAAVGLLETSPDPEIRADLCWGLVAVTASEAIDALLRRLRSDVDDEVRLQAVNALSPTYWQVEKVQDALHHTAYHDPSDTVRSRASHFFGASENTIENW